LRGSWARWLVAAVLVSALLYFALRGAPLPAIWETLRGLRSSQILLILLIDSIALCLITVRWWVIVRAQGGSVRYLSLLAARLSAFGISYFTFGPQVGGEPLQVLHLRHRYGATYAGAAATVVLDKLLELLVNFLFLLLGLAALLRTGVLHLSSALAVLGLLLLAGLAAWPALHIALLRSGRYPVSRMLRAVRAIPMDSGVIRFVWTAERLAGRLCRRRPRALVAAIGASALASGAAVIEYALITSFIGIGLTAWQFLSAWTAGWLSFLVPVPGGLGALEASQVYALRLFGASTASAIGVALVMRGRDLLVGGLGVLLSVPALERRKSELAVADVIPSTNGPQKTG
jgi:uncharacterized protein (TIRG00374 family)